MWFSIRGVTRDIAKDGATDDGVNDPVEGWTGGPGWGRSSAAGEMLGVFGPVFGSGLDAELADGPPWQPVGSGDAAGLLAAYRQAQMLRNDLRAALVGAGLSAGEFPELAASVDGQGRPVVRLGEVSGRTGERLARVLRAAPIPPAGRGRAA